MKRLALLALLFGCKTVPDTGTSPPSVTDQELTVVDQGLTDFRLRLDGTVQSPTAATLEEARFELVVDGQVIKSGTTAMKVVVPAGGSAKFSVEEASTYVKDAAELVGMSQRGGTLLAALRGKLRLKTSGGARELDFARSREIRVPKLPEVVLQQADGARYSAQEVTLIFLLGVKNPNPYPIRMAALDFEAHVGGRKMTDGRLGQGESVGGGSTGVFEVQVPLTKDTYGQEVTKLIQKRVVPYELRGALTGSLFERPYELKGNVRLNVSR